MATWLAHLRIAHKILPLLSGIDKKAFIVGNIAPDSGVSTGKGDFHPPVSFTHFSKDGQRQNIDSERFFNRYLITATSIEAKSFYLGYYVHLLADILWTNTVALPNVSAHHEKFEKDRCFVDVVKKDWYDQDRSYLAAHPDCKEFSYLKTITAFENDFIDFFTRGAFTTQIDKIINFYTCDNTPPEREYIFFTADEMDSFIELAYNNIILKLKEKNLINFGGRI